MRFNTEFGISEKLDYFDPILVADTELFVDPFAMFKETCSLFADAHEKIIRFFNEAFFLAVKSEKNENTVSFKKLQDMLVFPEVNEIGLGYSDSNSGAGASKHFRDQMIDAIFCSIESGLKEFRHFEEVGILEAGIGCDRISDITCNILKSSFIKYTQNICEMLSVPMIPVRMRHIDFDYTQLRWLDGTVNLPFNKYKNRGIILVPERFLNDLPSINSDDFKDYIWETKNDTLRNDLNYAIKSDIDKEAIIRLARANPSWISEYENVKEYLGYKAYDLDNDPKGRYIWSSTEVQMFTANNPISSLPQEDFSKCILEMCCSFKSFVENEGGYKLLWNDNKPKPESAAQLLLYGVTKSHCMYLDIDITRESNSGSGPVDFKFSQGYNRRVLIETKLVSNSKYWNGLTKQLPKYMTAEGIQNGIFMLIAFNEDELIKCTDLIEKAKALVLPYKIEIIIVDASNNKVSASKL